MENTPIEIIKSSRGRKQSFLYENIACFINKTKADKANANIIT